MDARRISEIPGIADAGSRPKLRVLAFGWEFAPVLSGGLGVACAGLGRALVQEGVDLTFVLPKLPRPITPDGIHILDASKAATPADCSAAAASSSPETASRTIAFETFLAPYQGDACYRDALETWTAQGRPPVSAHRSSSHDASLYGRDLLQEVERMAAAARTIAAEVPHDVIHCHDWMTFAAGVAARGVSGKPLVVHVHSTESDRSGGGDGNVAIRAREAAGLLAADCVVAVSEFTRGKILEQYPDVPEWKVRVVHNGVEPAADTSAWHEAPFAGHPVVLFLGRLTAQKGPEWFLRAAVLVHGVRPGVRFVVAGSGEILPWMIERAAELGLAGSMFFTGFLSGDDIDRAYAMADVFVMPSVSEPFGLVPVEAMLRGTPAIVSRQSGVSEVLRHCLKVDFWDTDDLADKIVGVIDHAPLAGSLASAGHREASSLGWQKPARRLVAMFEELAGRVPAREPAGENP